MRWLISPRDGPSKYSLEERRIVSRECATASLEQFKRWPGYLPSPLRNLSALAEQLGIGSVLYKDESARFGLGSFKALGGTYAAARALARVTSSSTLGSADTSVGSRTFCCATDGNHGRAVAFAAKRLGLDCVVFMHAGAPERKADAIRALGARVIRTPGNYDDSVAIAAEAARSNGWIAVMDTSSAEFDETVADVMNGYAASALEVYNQLNGRELTHVFVQAGVGGLAAAVAGTFTEVFGEDRPLCVVVEPERAACILECARHGAPTRLQGELHTAMAMLSCGEASRLAWTILKHRADAFVAIEDQAAIAACEVLTKLGLDVGVSGAASLAGLIEVLRNDVLRQQLRIGGSSCVLVFGTEGADAH